MDFEFVIKTVLNSKFFQDGHSASSLNRSHSMLLKEIKTDSICFPLRMRHYINLWSLSNLNELLDIEPCKILRCRNYGSASIVESQRAILKYLYGIRDIIEAYEIPFDADEKSDKEKISDYKNNKVIKYIPLLKGTYKTSVFYYYFIFRDLSAVSIPKSIELYFCRRNDLKKISDILNINYDVLLNERNIGFKSISSLQIELINLLHLEKINHISSSENTVHLSAEHF